jgi:LysR family glycine cleavage system transcriptional activator
MKKLPPLIELRAFDAAARHLSFKKAAAELGVTPTAISHQIRLLERYCGRALFRRRPRPLSLTEAGAGLFPVIRDGLEAFATAIAAVKRDDAKQSLRVTTTNAFASRWLVPRLPSWAKSHPNAPLEVIGTDSVLDLHAGDGDVAIRYATSRTAPKGGIAEELLSDTFWPVCSPQLLSPGGRLKRAADLAKHVLVHSYWSPSDLEPPTWQRWLALARRKWRDVPEFKDMQHLSFREELHAIEAVIAGQGIGIFSNVLVAPELAAGTLVKAFDLSLPGYRFYLVRAPGHPREKAIQAFSKWLQAVV